MSDLQLYMVRHQKLNDSTIKWSWLCREDSHKHDTYNFMCAQSTNRERIINLAAEHARQAHGIELDGEPPLWEKSSQPPAADSVTTPKERAERAAAARMAGKAHELMSRCAEAAQARLDHHDAINHPREFGDQMFAIAQARRQADAKVKEAAESYIEEIIKSAPRSN